MGWNPNDIRFLESLTGTGRKEMQKWRCLVRNGRMLLLIRDGAPRQVLRLYQPQRILARCIHMLVKLTYSLGGFSLLKRIDLDVGDNSPWATIENCTEAKVQAILLGNPIQDERRAIMYMAGSGGHAVVAKVGVGSMAREVVTREYEFIKRWSDDYPAMQQCAAWCEGADWSAFVTDFLSGESVGMGHANEVLGILDGWITKEPAQSLSRFSQWEGVCRGWPYAALAGELESAGERIAVIPSLSHRDMAPWNVIRNADGEIKVIDWESGIVAGIPGWDWVHYLYQTATLIDRKTVDETASFLEEMLQAEQSKAYLRAAGWDGEEKWLLRTYLTAEHAGDPVLKKNVLACLVDNG